MEVGVLQNNQWNKIAEATSIGAKRLIGLPNYVTTQTLRIHIVQSAFCIVLSDLGIFKEPEQSPLLQMKRSKDGMISFNTLSFMRAIRYITDGTEPGVLLPYTPSVLHFVGAELSTQNHSIDKIKKVKGM